MTTTTKFCQDSELTADNCMKGAFWSDTLKLSGWQRIETAPKDEQSGILACDENGKMCVACWDEGADAWIWYENNKRYVTVEAKYWMPLPKLPTT